MFHPLDHPLERGWVGRIEGDRVVHLAAQTLQSFFTGGGTAREHAVYPLDGVRLLAPVLQPPAVRIFESQEVFAFANPAAVAGPGTAVSAPLTTSDKVSQAARAGGSQAPSDKVSQAARAGGSQAARAGGSQAPSDKVSQGGLTLLPRLAAVIGADGVIGGFTALLDWRAPARPAPKDSDFALGLGPLVVTPDELDPEGLAASIRVDGGERLRGRFTGFDWEAARALAAAGTSLRPGDLLAGPCLAEVAEIGPGAMVELEVEGIGVLAQAVEG